MSTIRVVLGYDRQDLMLSAVVAETLAGLPDFHVIGGRPLRPEQIGMALSGEPIDVAVLIGDSDRFEQISGELLARHQAAVILRLSVIDDWLNLEVPSQIFGLPELVDILRTLARAPRLGCEVCAAIDRDALPARGDPLVLRRAAQAWLDALFGAHLRHRRETLRQLALEGGVSEQDIHLATLNPETMLAAYAEDEPLREVAAEEWAAFERALATAPRDPLHALITRLGLETIEQQALIICLAPELDVRFQRAIGSLHDDLSRRRPTLGLICNLLGEPLAVRAKLAEADTLRIMVLIAGPRLDLWAADELLEIDPPIAAWLLEQGSPEGTDPLLRRLVRRTAWSYDPNPPSDADARRLVQQFEQRRHGERIVVLGPEPEAWRVRAEAAAASVGAELLRLDGARLAALAEDDQRSAVVRAVRHARLFELLPVLDAGELEDPAAGRMLGAALAQFSATVQRPLLVIAGPSAEFPELLFGAAAILESSGSTVAAAQPIAAAADALGLPAGRADIALLSGSYHLPEGLAAAAPRVARAIAAGRCAAEPGVEDLRAACRKLANPRLPRFARRITPTVTLDDVVLPSDRRSQLDEIVNQVRHSAEVMDAWGFAAGTPYGRGVAALFSGPSGSGKTMSAHAIANALGCDLFQVNLAAVVSKYIGETEKNIDLIFSEAERGCAVLLFDECDALFGKRSETKDSHDRYANIEVSFLLQRLESFTRGLACLTTNFKQNIDFAFMRRFRFVLDFPMPDAAGREAIWRQCLPQTAPLDPDIDLRFIARRLELSGGAIRQITLRAAFAAAAERSPIAMRHLVEATRAELGKAGMHQALQELTERVA